MGYTSEERAEQAARDWLRQRASGPLGEGLAATETDILNEAEAEKGRKDAQARRKRGAAMKSACIAAAGLLLGFAGEEAIRGGFFPEWLSFMSGMPAAWAMFGSAAVAVVGGLVPATAAKRRAAAEDSEAGKKAESLRKRHEELMKAVPSGMEPHEIQSAACKGIGGMEPEEGISLDVGNVMRRHASMSDEDAEGIVSGFSGTIDGLPFICAWHAEDRKEPKEFSRKMVMLTADPRAKDGLREAEATATAEGSEPKRAETMRMLICTECAPSSGFSCECENGKGRISSASEKDGALAAESLKSLTAAAGGRKMSMRKRGRLVTIECEPCSALFEGTALSGFMGERTEQAARAAREAAEALSRAAEAFRGVPELGRRKLKCYGYDPADRKRPDALEAQAAWTALTYCEPGALRTCSAEPTKDGIGFKVTERLLKARPALKEATATDGLGLIGRTKAECTECFESESEGWIGLTRRLSFEEQASVASDGEARKRLSENGWRLAGFFGGRGVIVSRAGETGMKEAIEAADPHFRNRSDTI